MEGTEETETMFTVTMSGFQMRHHLLALVCTTGLHAVSSKTNTADGAVETSVCTSNIFLCPGTTFECAGQCLHRGYAAVCTHTPRSSRRGVSVLKTRLAATRKHIGTGRR